MIVVELGIHTLYIDAVIALSIEVALIVFARLVNGEMSFIDSAENSRNSV